MAVRACGRLYPQHLVSTSAADSLPSACPTKDGVVGGGGGVVTALLGVGLVPEEIVQIAVGRVEIKFGLGQFGQVKFLGFRGHRTVGVGRGLVGWGVIHDTDRGLDRG